MATAPWVEKRLRTHRWMRSLSEQTKQVVADCLRQQLEPCFPGLSFQIRRVNVVTSLTDWEYGSLLASEPMKAGCPE